MAAFTVRADTGKKGSDSVQEAHKIDANHPPPSVERNGVDTASASDTSIVAADTSIVAAPVTNAVLPASSCMRCPWMVFMPRIAEVYVISKIDYRSEARCKFF